MRPIEQSKSLWVNEIVEKINKKEKTQFDAFDQLTAWKLEKTLINNTDAFISLHGPISLVRAIYGSSVINPRAIFETSPYLQSVHSILKDYSCKLVKDKTETEITTGTATTTATATVTENTGINDPRMYIDYIYLDEDEHRRFSEVSHEFVFDSYMDKLSYELLNKYNI